MPRRLFPSLNFPRSLSLLFTHSGRVEYTEVLCTHAPLPFFVFRPPLYAQHKQGVLHLSRVFADARVNIGHVKIVGGDPQVLHLPLYIYRFILLLYTTVCVSAYCYRACQNRCRRRPPGTAHTAVYYYYILPLYTTTRVSAYCNMTCQHGPPPSLRKRKRSKCSTRMNRYPSSSSMRGRQRLASRSQPRRTFFSWSLS